MTQWTDTLTYGQTDCLMNRCVLTWNLFKEALLFDKDRQVTYCSKTFYFPKWWRINWF